MHVLRSPHAHACILGIEAGRAMADPACLGLWTASDLPPAVGTLPCVDLVPSSKPAHQTVLARDTVRYAGEPVAIVLATDPARAEDLAERIGITYAPLPPVLSATAGVAADSPLLYPAFATNIVHETEQRTGQPEEVFRRAALVLERCFPMHRVAAAPMEPRGVIAAPEDGGTGRFVVHSTSQIPHMLRRALAEITGLPLEALRVIAPLLGGGFGVKEAIYAEEVLALLAARRLGRAVAWIEDRAEHFQASCHGREEVITLRIALDPDGTVTAADAVCLADIGAAYALVGNTPGAAVATIRGPYRIPNFSARSCSVVTNKTPLNVYRGAGHPQAVLAMERMLDIAAATLEIDRAEIRRRNLLQPHELPADRGVAYPGSGGRIVFDSGDFPRTLETTLEAIGYSEFAGRRRAAARPGLLLGLGLSLAVEMTASGPAEPARVTASADGSVELCSGITAMGQGTETTLTAILADRLGLPQHAVRFRGGDTDPLPDAVGSFASRGASVGGNAAAAAGTSFIGRALTLAARVYDVPVERLEWQNGAIIRHSGPNTPTSLASLIAAAIEAGLDALAWLDTDGTFDVPGIAYANCCHAAVVAVDVASGAVQVLDYAVTHDCGRVANPLLVDGQIMGGVVQGIGATLSEALTFAPDGEPRTTGFWQYVLPTAAVTPRFILRHLETPSPHNPLGMKGAGESGFTGTPGAVVNAIADALAPLGVEPLGSGPYTPATILSLLRAASRSIPSMQGALP